jgi:ubiquinone/menaquinone biosynthesis C-methylase UbiE
MNEEHHWNNIAKKYNEEIFDVFASDQRKLLPIYFKKHANRKGTAIDFGCGNGKAFPYLATLFKEIIGIDISQELLNQAKARPHKNTRLLQADLSDTKIKLPKVDLVFSCNVIMLPEVEKNYDMLRNVYRCLKPSGTALLVVPSTESILFSAWRMIDWYKREGVAPKQIDPSELSYFKGAKQDILQGVFHIDEVPTKHYAAPELEVILAKAKLKLTSLEKLEYSWKTEFASPPSWMKAPYPWDWLVECTKPEKR